MQSIKIRIYFIAFLCTTPLHAYAQVFTEQQAISFGLEHHPKLGVAFNAISIADNLATQASLSANPTFSFDVENLNAEEKEEYQLAIEQPIDVFGKQAKQSGVYKESRSVALHELEITRLQVIAEIRTAFAESLALDRRYSLSLTSQALAKETENSVNAKIEAGRVSKTEQIKANLDLSKAQIKTQSALQDVDLSLRDFEVALGADSGVITSVSGELSNTLPYASYEDLEAFFLQSAYMKRWQAQSTVQQARIQAVKTHAKPDLNIGASIGRDSNEDTIYGASISMELPLFNRSQGTYSAQQTELQSLLLNTALEQRKHLAQLKNNFDKATQLESQSLALAENMLPLAKEAYSQVKEAYRLGKVTYLELLDAQRSLIELQHMQINTQLALQLAIIKLDLLSGSSADSTPTGEIQ